MLDVHNHVLFGLDDGCRTPEETSALARLAKGAGHGGFVATPHIRPGMFDNTVDAIRRRRDEARPLVEEAGLELFLGAEHYFSIEVLEAARRKDLLTLGESSRYVLIEFPQDALPPRWQDVLFEIRVKGYVPVIAHPERCAAIQADLERAEESLARCEVLLQLDLGSLVGHYGRAAKKAASKLVDRGAYHVAACDLHRPDDVAAIVAPSLRELEKRTSAATVHRMTKENPRRIVRNEDVIRTGTR